MSLNNYLVAKQSVQVEGEGSEEIDDEPCSKIIEGYRLPVGHHFSFPIDVRSPEI